MKQAIDPNDIGNKSVAWLTQFVRDQIRQGVGGASSQGPPPVITSFTPTTAGAGDTVTITGSGFTFATAVDVNGVPAASFTVVSDTSITFVVPTDASTGPIHVTNMGGSTASATNLTSGVLTWTNFASFANSFRQANSGDAQWALTNGAGGTAGTPSSGSWATTPEGLLLLRGAIATDTVGGTSNLTAFTLPTGARPANAVLVNGSNGTSAIKVVIQATGVVVPVTAAQATCIRFDGIFAPLN